MSKYRLVQIETLIEKTLPYSNSNATRKYAVQYKKRFLFWTWWETTGDYVRYQDLEKIKQKIDIWNGNKETEWITTMHN